MLLRQVVFHLGEGAAGPTATHAHVLQVLQAPGLEQLLEPLLLLSLLLLKQKGGGKVIAIITSGWSVPRRASSGGRTVVVVVIPPVPVLLTVQAQEKVVLRKIIRTIRVPHLAVLCCALFYSAIDGWM
jgi:hypothetical protein